MGKRISWIHPSTYVTWIIVTEYYSHAPGLILCWLSINYMFLSGYGNLTPKTDLGKLATIIYALIGIPLMFLYMANIGDILGTSFKYMYTKFCRYGPRHKCSHLCALGITVIKHVSYLTNIFVGSWVQTAFRCIFTFLRTLFDFQQHFSTRSPSFQLHTQSTLRHWFFGRLLILMQGTRCFMEVETLDLKRSWQTTD